LSYRVCLGCAEVETTYLIEQFDTLQHTATHCNTHCNTLIFASINICYRATVCVWAVLKWTPRTRLNNPTHCNTLLLQQILQHTGIRFYPGCRATVCIQAELRWTLRPSFPPEILGGLRKYNLEIYRLCCYQMPTT